MLQNTVRRVEGLNGVSDKCTVICNDSHRFLIAEQLREIQRPATIVLEPEGRNTAPAVALAAFLEAETDPGAILLVMPADHVIADTGRFRAAIAHGIQAARENKLVTFGVVPTHAETGYGYIEARLQDDNAVPIRSFVEKPDLTTARAYVDGGEHFWNSGMFVFSADAYLNALGALEPAMYEPCKTSIAERSDGDFIRPDAASFLRCPSDSIDYAVMEKTDDAVMVPLDAGWSDVGSWAALHNVTPTDDDGNSLHGDVLVHDCTGVYAKAESRLVTAVGLRDLVIVETKDSTLVASMDKVQDVKVLVDKLNEQERSETRLHRQVFRPWGSFDSLENADGFQVKRLVVNPGSVLSLQKHAHRAEHWVVVRGKARITLNDDEFDLGVNKSTYIAIGDVHRIANPFEEPVHIIEVQCGDYLGEDDIVRLEDNYGREGTTT